MDAGRGRGSVRRRGTGRGNQSTVSTVDTQYAPASCSPLGKLSQTSEPYAPGGSDAWTTYTYDASGRTLSAALPDGSTTSYVYQGNTVKVTDPAGKWKTFTMDAFGNLTSVVEPDPSLGNVTTTYTYDVLNQLIQVSMPRSTTTQMRTFSHLGGYYQHRVPGPRRFSPKCMRAAPLRSPRSWSRRSSRSPSLTQCAGRSSAPTHRVG
jgi:YD repeat-containing protein